MTKYIIMDTETTGLTKTDEVIQFSAVVLEDLRPDRLVNFYCETQVPVSAGAFNVHHLDNAKLHKLSESQVFEDNWLEFVDSLRGAKQVWIDWSSGGFDERLINQTLVNNGLDDYFHFPRCRTLTECSQNMISEFDLMGALRRKLSRRSMKLEDAANTLPYTREQINFVYDKVTASVPNMDKESRFHNAMYDAFVTYLVFNYHFANGV